MVVAGLLGVTAFASATPAFAATSSYSSSSSDIGVFVAAYVFWVLAFGAIGAAIGSSKGKTGTGLLLGLLLGLIGIIILFFLSSDKPSPAAPGWRPDPYGRHELRYFDGANWRKNVSDSGVASLDDPVPAPPAPAVAYVPQKPADDGTYAPGQLDEKERKGFTTKDSDDGKALATLGAPGGSGWIVDPIGTYGGGYARFSTGTEWTGRLRKILPVQVPAEPKSGAPHSEDQALRYCGACGVQGPRSQRFCTECGEPAPLS